MNALLTALSGATRGAPLTLGRPYCLLPVCTETLLAHAARLFSELTLVHAPGLLLGALPSNVRAVSLEDEPALRDAFARAQALVPGDLLLLEEAPPSERLLLCSKEGSEETDVLRTLLEQRGLGERFPRRVVAAMRVNYPWELLDANQRLTDLTVRATVVDPSAIIEDQVTIKGAVRIGPGTIVRAGSYLEGPLVIGARCDIGPMAHLRPHTSIGDECRIGKTELVDCVIMGKTTAKHFAYLGHSVLGADVNIAAFTVTADYRHDASKHWTLVDGKKMDTGRRKLGAFLGDRVRTGVSTSLYPGRKLWPGMTTLPGEVVSADKRGDA